MTATDSEVELETISKSGKAPKQRLLSARTAVQKFHLWREAAAPRLRRAAVIQGIYDGNPPYRQDKRRRMGNEWQANFNTLEGAARLEQAKVPFYDLSSSTQTLYDTPTVVDNPNGLDAHTASGVICEEFDQELKAWPGREFASWMMLNDFIAFNRGFLYWTRDDSWHYTRIPWHRVRFPEGYGLDVDEWEEFAIEHAYSVERMWSFVRDRETAEDRGYNVDEVILAIRRAVPAWHEDDPMAIQARLKEHLVEPSAMAATVQCASVFTKEFDGRWSRMIVPVFREEEPQSAGKPTSMVEAGEAPTPAAQMKKMSDKSWLFYRQGVADELQQLLAVFIFETHDGSMNAIEGQGKKIAPMMQAKNRIACATADNTMMRQNIVMQPVNPSSVQKMGTIQVSGGVTVLPPGFNVQNAQIWGDVETGIAVNEHFDRILDVNTGVYRPQFEKPSGNPETATAASLRFSQATVLSSSAVNRFYTQDDRFGQELFRRMTMPKEDLRDDTNAGVRSALAFQRRCRERGVSREQLMDIVERKAVKAVRSIGNGSAAMRQQMLGGMVPAVPYMGQRGLRNFWADWVGAYGGYTKVRRYFPPEDQANIPTLQDWSAEQENNDMQQGASPLIADGQDHEVHAIRHVMKGMEAIQAVQQGAEPTAAYMFLQMAIPHISEHLPGIGRENVRKQVEQALGQLEQGFGQIQQAVQKQRQQAQQAQQMSFDQQMKMQETQSKMQERQLKLEQGLMQKEQKHEQAMRISEEQTRADIARADVEAVADIGRKAIETKAKTATKEQGA